MNTLPLLKADIVDIDFLLLKDTKNRYKIFANKLDSYF